MIRVNLLEGARASVRPKTGGGISLSIGGAELTGPAKAGLAVVGLALLVMVGHYFYLQWQGGVWQTRLARAQAENSHLQTIQRVYDAAVKHQALLRQRIGVIEDLRGRQSSPSHLLVAFGNAVNQVPAVWLNSVKQTSTGIDVQGSAFSLYDVANLMSQLRATGRFQAIQLIESTRSESVNGHPGPFQFELRLRTAPSSGKSGVSAGSRG